ncbi:MAG: hypothetical protein QXS24_02590 [Desulfurococcaceae archaeon]
MIKVLTLYFTRDKLTFNPRSLESVVNQMNVSQDIYVISAEPIDLWNYGFRISNVVIPTKSTWPVPIKIGYSFNAALVKINKEIDRYDYVFKVDGDVILPKDYLINLASRKPHVAGIGPALLISTVFFKKLMKNKYPVTYCDDGFIFALAISKGVWPLHYTGGGDVIIPPIITLKDREYIYGVEYYKWGLPPILLVIHPITRIYLKITRKMKEYQRKNLRAYLYNAVGYVHALIHNVKKYEFSREYGKMRIIHLYHKFRATKAVDFHEN